jgi:hypothetical protein
VSRRGNPFKSFRDFCDSLAREVNVPGRGDSAPRPHGWSDFSSLLRRRQPAYFIWSPKPDRCRKECRFSGRMDYGRSILPVVTAECYLRCRCFSRASSVVFSTALAGRNVRGRIRSRELTEIASHLLTPHPIQCWCLLVRERQCGTGRHGSAAAVRFDARRLRHLNGPR